MLKDKLSLVPHKPGCYLMKNKDNNIIYVGKAKDLKKRLLSYFRGIHTGKTLKLINEIANFEYIVVSTEQEALILELNLIKKHDPKYNILLRDDKSYPYIELTNDKIPRLLIVRYINKKKDKSNLYGPYPNVLAARKTVNLLNKIYPLKKCESMPKKECLYYHIGECLGYCIKEIDPVIIENMKKKIIMFLNGNHDEVTTKIKNDMNLASNNLNYEKAKELKELLDYINITLTRQKVEIKDNHPIDVFGYYILNDYICIQIFFIRSGKIMERYFKTFALVDDVKEELERFIITFYNQKAILPYYLLIPEIGNAELLSNYLNIKVIKPLKGIKHDLVEMANKNALMALKEYFNLMDKEEAKTIKANDTLKKLLHLDKLYRIDIFDNSNLFGSYNVSSMVVFKDGIPAKNDYRKYKISIDKNDDINTLKEVIYRRYFKVISEQLEKPDLIIVDGGYSQINATISVLESLNLNIPVVGLKKDNKHNTSALIFNNNEISIDSRSEVFNYLARIQDEVHRFTITYHKNIRSKGSLASILDSIPGIGPKRRDELLKKYKTIDTIKSLELNELEKIIPNEIAIKLKDYLKDY